MKVTQEQINRLYEFIRQHFVEWYDLQTELVDHLANAIEHQWKDFPNRTFEEALQIEFKKFGVFGFMEVVEKRQAVLNKKYNKIVWTNFKNFFHLPQIIGTFSAVGILFLILKISMFSEIIFLGITTLLLIFFFVEIFRNIKKANKLNQQTGKKWLFKEIINGYGQTTGFCFLPFQIIFHIRDYLHNDVVLLIVSFFIISVALVQYIILIIIPNKADEYLKEIYPEYELSN